MTTGSIIRNPFLGPCLVIKGNLIVDYFGIENMQQIKEMIPLRGVDGGGLGGKVLEGEVGEEVRGETVVDM